MSVLAAMLIITLIIRIAVYLFDKIKYMRGRRDRHGPMLLLAGTNHFLSGQVRYVPMMPEILSGQARALGLADRRN